MAMDDGAAHMVNGMKNMMIDGNNVKGEQPLGRDYPKMNVKGEQHEGRKTYQMAMDEGTAHMVDGMKNMMIDGNNVKGEQPMEGEYVKGEPVGKNYSKELIIKGMESLQINEAESGPTRMNCLKGEHTEERVPYGYLKGLRERKWREAYGWDGGDLDRKIRSTEALPEHLQDFEKNMVLIGSDVISLYPNLEVDKVVNNIREAIEIANVKWEEVDYREGVRYLALNWDLETCNKSSLRRVIPIRRGKRGTRPGLKGAGPQGKLKGDQEQWIFMDVVLTEEEKRKIVAEVVALATKAMFNNHFYKFGGKMYHQAQGGPIGLRGTCAVARMVMQLFDQKWGSRLENLGLTTWLNFRYVDDSRTLLPPIKPGWRWEDGELLFCLRWELEDKLVSGESRTKEIIRNSMMGVEDYLNFTVESGEEFEGGWLPTLDVNLKVDKANTVQFKFYEKETCAKKTVQKDSAMEENSKIQTVSNDLVRRLNNTRESMGAREQIKVVNDYGQKLINSGYALDQVKKILINGIKGYEGRKARCKKEGRSLYRTAKESMGARYKKKLLAKSSWYKGTKDRAAEHYQKPVGAKMSSRKANGREKRGGEPKTVLFVEQTGMGELGSRMRELMTRLTPILGFSIKVVERAGSSLKSHFPQSSLWDGAPCGRETCVTCTQGAEVLPPCTRKSLVYENVCRLCNPGATSKGELEGVNPTIPSIYVGETSRTVQERAVEHWSAARGSNNQKKETSHMRTHMEQVHGGGEPMFIMRVVEFHRTALSRQAGEAVRIMRRGGAGSVLNSRGEFNRCYIPRLRVEEPSKVEELEKWEEQELEKTMELLREEDKQWEGRMRGRRHEGTKSSSTAHGGGKRATREPPGGRRRKKLKFSLVEDDWGIMKTTSDLEEGSKADSREDQTVLEEGATDQPWMGAIATTRTEGGGATQNTECGQAQQHSFSSLGGGAATTLVGVETGDQLHSPRCSKQTSIVGYVKTRTIVDSSNIKNVKPADGVKGGVVVETYLPEVGGSYSPDVTVTTPENDQQAEPSGGSLSNDRIVEEDICGQTNKLSTNECELDKRLLRCKKHNCKLNVINVTSKKWQWVERKRQYGYVSKKTKKYVCVGLRENWPDTGGCQGELMVPEIADVAVRTTDNKLNENKLDDMTYSGEGSTGSGQDKRESMAMQYTNQ